MQDHVSRLVGLEGLEVKGVIEEGDQLDLEVELVARAGLLSALRARKRRRQGAARRARA